MVAAITLLPAMLRLLGRRVLSAKARAALAEGHLAEEHASRGFARWAALVRTRPVALGLVGLLALGTIAIPTLDLRLGTADQGNDPSGTTTREAYDLLAEGFAAAVMLDALVIRMLVVPALMHLLGRANWWLPGWLDRWLPAVSVEVETSGRQATGSTRSRHAAGSTTYPAMAVLSTPDTPAEVDAGEVEGGWAAGFEAGQRAGMRARYDQGFRAGFEDAAQMDPEQRFEAGYDAGFREIMDLDQVSEPQPHP